MWSWSEHCASFMRLSGHEHAGLQQSFQTPVGLREASRKPNISALILSGSDVTFIIWTDGRAEAKETKNKNKFVANVCGQNAACNIYAKYVGKSLCVDLHGVQRKIDLQKLVYVGRVKVGGWLAVSNIGSLPVWILNRQKPQPTPLCLVYMPHAALGGRLRARQRDAKALRSETLRSSRGGWQEGHRSHRWHV